MVGADVEYRRKLWKRIGGVAFVGLGEVAPGYPDLNGDDLLPSAGVGLRVQLTKENPFNYSIDVAVGNNDTIVYFTVGEAF